MQAIIMRSVYLTALRLYTSEFQPSPASGPAGPVRPIAHAFWASDDCLLPDYARDGLLSAVPHFRRVFLWQYETVKNLPEGVLGRPAAYLLPVHVARALQGTPAVGGKKRTGGAGVGRSAIPCGGFVWRRRRRRRLLVAEGPA